MTFNNLYALQFTTVSDFDKNLSKLTQLIDKCDENSVIVAPEVSLSGFYYQDMDYTNDFSQTAKQELLRLSSNKLIAITLIEKIDGKFYNVLNVFYNNKIIHTQSKVKLFTLSQEPSEFESGNIEDIKIFNVNGIKFGGFICFELRFTQIWDRLKGADVLLIPAMWGKPRKKHFELLTSAVSMINQCYVVASNRSNDDMASSSSIIDPLGNREIDDSKEIIKMKFDTKKIRKIRRYLDVGIK